MSISKAADDAGSAAASLPSPDDVATLRGAISKISTAAKVIEIAASWLVDVLNRIPSGSGTSVRCVAGFRVQRPAGTLKSIVVYAGASAANVSIQIERTGIMSGDALVPQVVPHESAADPFVSAFQKALGTQFIVAVVPISNSKGLWGAIALGFQSNDFQFEVPARLLRVLARILNNQLQQLEGQTVSTVIDPNPRCAVSVDDFLTHVDLLLACAPKKGPGVALLACGLRGGAGTEPGVVRRLIRQVAQRILEATRGMDVATILDDDVAIVALPRADEATCGMVTERIRAHLRRHLPQATSGGFAFQVLDATTSGSREMLKKIANGARKAATPI